MRPRARSRDAAIVYAQLVEIGTMPDRRVELDRIVSDRLIPALEQERGFAGVLHLVDRETGRRAADRSVGVGGSCATAAERPRPQPPRGLREPRSRSPPAHRARIRCGKSLPGSEMSVHDEADPAAWQAAFIERFRRQEPRAATAAGVASVRRGARDCTPARVGGIGARAPGGAAAPGSRGLSRVLRHRPRHGLMSVPGGRPAACRQTVSDGRCVDRDERGDGDRHDREQQQQPSSA